MCAIHIGPPLLHPLTTVNRVFEVFAGGGPGEGAGDEGHSQLSPPPHGSQAMPPGHIWAGVDEGSQHARLLELQGLAAPSTDTAVRSTENTATAVALLRPEERIDDV